MKDENIKYETYTETVDGQTVKKYRVKVDNLQEITSDGASKTYALKPMTMMGIVKPIPVREVAGESAELYSGAENDYYRTLATNTGVKSSVIDRAYDGAELSLVLTGKTQFTGPLQWADISKQNERETAVNSGAAGDFMLYRYVDTNTNDNEHDSQMVAQVGTWNINSESDNGYYIYRDSNNNDPDTNTILDKYDNTGAAYVYFAKERLKLDEYKVDYILPSEYQTGTHLEPFTKQDANGNCYGEYNDARVFPNGAVVKNSLTGEIGYGVDAEWIAAELQGGTGAITYQLQYLDADGNWQNCTYKDGDNTVDNAITIDGFSAEQMEKYKMFNSVPKYDSDGNLIQYRVVQTDLSRSDHGKSGAYTTPIEMQYVNGKPTLIDENGDPVDKVTISVTEKDSQNREVTYKFEVTLVWDPSTFTFYYDYKLIGDVQIVMNKDWTPVPIDQIENVRNAKAKLQLTKYNYKTGKYEPYNKAIGNNGGLKYTNDGTTEINESNASSQREIFYAESELNTETTVYVQDGENNYTSLSDVTFEKLYSKDGRYYVEIKGAVPDGQTIYVKDTNNTYVELTSDTSGIFVVERPNVVNGDIKHIGEPHYAIELLNVPMYDDDGRLNRYSLEEVGIDPNPGTSAVYSAYIEQNPMVFTAQNIFGEGGEEIHFHKVWMDDGEEEYKKPVTIYMPARAMQLPFPYGGKNLAPTGWENMTEAQLAEAMNTPNTESSNWLFRTVKNETTGEYSTLWTLDPNHRYPDPLAGAGLGYHYLVEDSNSVITVPKKYYGTNDQTLTTVSYKAQVAAATTAPKVFKLQSKPTGADDSGYADFIDAKIKASSDFGSKQYTSDNSGKITMSSTDVVDRKYAVLLKDLPVNKEQGIPYTYTITTSEGTDWIVNSQQETLSSDGTKKDVLVSATAKNNSVAQFVVTIQRSYTINGTTTTEFVENVTGQRQVNAKTYAPTRGTYKIDALDGKYSFVFGDLPSGFDYRIVDENGDSVNNLVSNPQQNVDKTYKYVPYSTDADSKFKLPLSANSYYGNMTGDDATQLNLLSGLLTNVNNESTPYLLNTNHDMTEENVWTARIQVRLGYSYNPRSGNSDYGYDLRDYAEHIKSEGQANNKYYLRTDLDGSGMSAMQWMHDVQPESDAWINMLPAQYRDVEAEYQTYAVFEGLLGDGVGKEYRIIDDQNNPVSGAHIDIVADESGTTHHVIVSANQGKTLKFKLQQKTGENAYGDVIASSVKDHKGNALTASGGFYELYANVIDMTTGAGYSYVLNPDTADAKMINPTKYEWLSGIYEAVYNNGYKRYYAVQEIPCDTAIAGGRLSDVTFQNTRIGIVNYKIHFDWNVGTRLSEMKNVTLEIEADYHDGSDPHLVTFGDLGKEQITLELKDGVYDYYITNLPKYTQTGQVITYTVREVGINGIPFDKRGKCTLGNDDLYATIEAEDYILNDSSNSDDLMPLVITNSFGGTRDFTVNKIWLDDTNALDTRTDLYIQLWRHSTNTKHQVADRQIGKDYLWRKKASDSNNHWSFTYDKLSKYDSDGFR